MIFRRKGYKIRWISEIAWILEISLENIKIAFCILFENGKNFCKIQILSITNDIDEPFKPIINLAPKIISALTNLD